MNRLAQAPRSLAFALALALALALPGCAFFSPPPEDPFAHDLPDPPSREPVQESGAFCGRVSVEPSVVAARVGEQVEIVATIANCGNQTLTIDRGLCPDEGSGFRLLVQRGMNEWHLHARDEAEAAAIHDTACVRGESSVFGLPPSRGGASVVHTVTFRWNGTFASDPCWPAPSPREPACLQFAPAPNGPILLHARIVASGMLWEANATLGWNGTAVVRDPACEPLGVALEEGTIVISVAACEGDVTLPASAACNEPFPIRAEIVRGEERWTLAGSGAAVRDVGCYASPAERVLPAGTRGMIRLAWNGTFADAGCEECVGSIASPGEYELLVTMVTREGPVHTARAALVVPS